MFSLRHLMNPYFSSAKRLTHGAGGSNFELTPPRSSFPFVRVEAPHTPLRSFRRVLIFPCLLSNQFRQTFKLGVCHALR